MNMKSIRFYCAIVAGLMAILLVGCGGGETAVSTPPADNTIVEEVDLVVAATTSNGSISALATIKPIQQLNLSFGASAVVENISVRVGEAVTAGQLLAMLEKSELELSLQTAQEEVVVRQGDLAELTSETYAAQAALENQQAIAQAEVVLLTQELALEKAILNGAEGEVIQAQAQIDELALRISQGWASLPDDAVTIAQADLTRAQIAYDTAAYEYQKSLDREWESDELRDAYSSGLTQAELSLQQAQAALAAAQGNESAHAVGVNIHATQKQQAELALAQAIMTQQTYTMTLTIMEAEIAVAQLELERLQTWQNPYLDESSPAIFMAEARLRQAQIEVNRLENELTGATIEAPFVGVITAVYLQPGEWANAGTAVIEIMDTSGWLAETSNVSELEIGRIAIGQEATVRVHAVEGAELAGEVAIISPIAVVQQGDTTYSLTIALESTDLVLRSGMNAQVEILID
ncbi:MAG: HlyD family efflux transporter periplasmic adaptor subunit [Chloroflexi bacterium]|nr:HlyD family efflux transporter periplasmic adaptor subunit [Chloroflexota bacterium]